MDMELSGSANCLGPGVQVGEYRLQGVVGEGGFGIVYRARDLSLDRIVAVKEYMPSTLAGRMSSNQIHVRAQHKGAFDAGLRSFINEARLLAKFSHPALVHVYRFFEENGTAYMVMRYYEGQTFRAFLAEQQSSMNERWLSAMLCPILDVLEMLHAADCFHRDIAPDNVFLQESGMPVLLDFGAARRIIGDMTQALTMVLKPGFAPIEQYADDGAMPQGAWTDVYQLGAMIYLAITGKIPPTAVARMISDPIQMLTQEAYPGYSSQFLQGVHRALSVRPQDRPQSIAELKGLLGIRTHTAPAFSPWAMSGSAPLEDLAGGGGSGTTGFSATVPGALPMDMASPPAAPASVFAISPSQRIERVQEDLMSLVTQGSAAADAASPPAFEAVDSPTPPGYEPTEVDTGRAPPPVFAAAPVVTIPLNAPAVVGGFVSRPTGQTPPGDEAWAQTTQDVPLSAATPRSPRIGGSAGTRAPAWLWGAVAVAVLVLGAAVWWAIPVRNEDAGAQVAAAPSDAERWLAAKQQGTVASVEAYLADFPAGAHVQDARALLAALAPRAADPDVAVPPVAVAPAPSASVALPAAPPSAGPVALAPPPPAPASAPGLAPMPAPAPAPPARPVASTAPIPDRPVTEPGRAEPPAVRVEAKPAAAAETGKVVFRVMPWGNVRVNRSPVGTTPPLTQLELPEGQHQIEISNPAAPSVSRVVQVKKGEPVVISHKFE